MITAQKQYKELIETGKKEFKNKAIHKTKILQVLKDTGTINGRELYHYKKWSQKKQEKLKNLQKGQYVVVREYPYFYEITKNENHTIKETYKKFGNNYKKINREITTTEKELKKIFQNK